MRHSPAPFLALALLTACPRGPLSQVDAPNAVDREYDVQFGDNLILIANNYGVVGGYQRLAAINHIPNPNVIWGGQKLRVPTTETTLPVWPRIARATQVLTAVTGQPIAATRLALAPGKSGACVAVGVGMQACATTDATSRKMLLLRGANVVWSREIDTTPPDWFDPSTAPAPAATSDLLATRYQLDADAASEVVVAWKQEENDLGMSRWQVAVFDDAGGSRPPLTFQAANWGVGSVVAGGKDAPNDILATEWMLADEPTRQNDGWYLVGRRMQYASGALHPRAGSEILARRLLQTFTPATRPFGTVRAGAPAIDLAKAYARSTDPLVELASEGTTRGQVTAAARDQTGGLSLTLTTRAGTGTQRVHPTQDGLRRLGDAATGIVYPPDYTPADPTQLSGKTVLITSYYPGYWQEPWQVAWL